MSFPKLKRLNRRERRKRANPRRATAALLAGLVLVSGVATSEVVFNASAAHAVSIGAGIWFGGDVGAGSFIHSNGKIVYCAEMGKGTVMGNNPAMGATSALPAYNAQSFNVNGANFNNVGAPELSGDSLKNFNYVLSRWGATADNAQAGAVQIALWTIRSAGSTPGYQQMLDYMRTNVGPGVVAQANGMIAEAQNSNTASQAPADPRITPVGPYSGYVAVDPGTTELTITNGIFTETGTNRITFGSGTTSVIQVPFIGQAPADLESWDRYYTITVNGKYRAFVAGSSVAYGSPGDIGQGLAYGIGEWVEGDYKAVAIDPDTVWSPVLSTETPSKFIPEGEKFSDTVTFDVAEGSNPWRQSVNAAGVSLKAPITAKGTLYGPFLADPADNPSATPPKNAPVAARAEVRTSTDKGPGTYAVESDKTSREAGYYTWVWNIEFDDQLPSVQAPKSMEPSIPVNYFFTDGFGQISEGQITPSDISFSTQLSGDQFVIGDTFTDDVTAFLNKGGWLQTGGERTAFTLTGTVYALDKAPKQQATAPADTEVLATSQMTINGPDETKTSEPIQIPIDTDAKYLTVQWCLLDANQTDEAKGKAKEFCDDFGVPAESAEILRPEVTTQAQPEGAVKGDIQDTAIVTGALPKNAKTEVDFTAYLKPEAGQPKYDENWQPVVDENGDAVLWAEDEVADPAAVCAAQPVGRTDRVPVDSVGTITSPALKAESAGTVYWVEELFITPEGGEEIGYHKGKCGLPNETTEVVDPKVTTKATPGAMIDDSIFDTAIVTGPLSTREEISYEVTFEAYHRAEGVTTQPDEKLCTPDTKVWESTEPTPVDKAGEYTSEKWSAKKEHVGEILWVETLTRVELTDEGEKRSEVHRGECGAATEITKVTEPVPPVFPPLVMTGAESLAPLVGGAAALLLAAGAGAILWARRRRLSSVAAEVRDCGDAGE